jgi:hypothetical protein
MAVVTVGVDGSLATLGPGNDADMIRILETLTRSDSCFITKILIDAIRSYGVLSSNAQTRRAARAALASDCALQMK